MAITVVSDQTLVNATGGDAEVITNWTTTAAWSGTPAVSNDVFIQGSNAINARASTATPGTLALYWDHLTTQTANLDLSTGNHVYYWIKCFSLPGMEKRVRGGIGISISSTAGVTKTGTDPWSGINDSKQWFVTGSDFEATSGWVCYVVDPTSTANLSLGTPLMTSVDRIGIRAGALQTIGGGSVKPFPIIWDRISYGTKLTITGSTGTFQDIYTADSTTSNQYGILTKTGGIFFGAGKLFLGTAAQSAPCVFTDTNQTLVWQDFRVSSAFYEIQLAGNTTPNITTVTLGSYSGGLTSNGCSIRGTGLAAQYSIAPVIVSGGTGYTAGDTLTISGGTFSIAAQIKVITVSSGVITSAQMETEGAYSVPPTGTLSVTGGTGSNATFTLTFVGGSVWTLTASAANQTLNLYGCSLSELKSAALASTTTIRGTNFSNFGTITTNSAIIDNCTFQDLRTISPISATYALILASTTEVSNVTNCRFINCNRALKLTTAGTYTFNNLTFTGNTYDLENSSTAVSYATYSESNRDADTALYSGTTVGVGQSFTGTGGDLSSCKFYLKKTTGSTTGTAVAKVYAVTGSVGSYVPTGSALAVSDNLDVSTLTTTQTLTALQFTNTNNITLTNSTNYFLSLEYSSGNSTDNVLVGYDGSSPSYSNQNYSSYNGSTWTADSGRDLCFYVYTGGIVIINKSNGANPVTYITTGNGSTRIVTAAALTIKIVNSEGATITQDCEVTIVKVSDESVLWHEDGIVDGITTYSYSTGTGTDVYINVLNVAGFQNKTAYNTLSGSDEIVTVTLDEDRFYANT